MKYSELIIPWIHFVVMCDKINRFKGVFNGIIFLIINIKNKKKGLLPLKD